MSITSTITSTLLVIAVVVLSVNEQCHVESFQQSSLLLHQRPSLITTTRRTHIHAFTPYTKQSNNHNHPLTNINIKMNMITNVQTLTTTNKHRSNTKLFGIDFDQIGEDDECDFTDGDLSQIDLSKCLPFPNPNVVAEDVVTLCMDALLYNDEPKTNAGLEVCFNFSSDRCRAGKKISLLFLFFSYLLFTVYDFEYILLGL